jgi:hypothetical protein
MSIPPAGSASSHSSIQEGETTKKVKRTNSDHCFSHYLYISTSYISKYLSSLIFTLTLIICFIKKLSIIFEFFITLIF